jgi:hypothetical protein
MPRVFKRPGVLLKVPIGNGRHFYAQWLADGTARFFALITSTDMAAEEIVKVPVAFRVLVAIPTISRYGWINVGAAEVPPEFSEPQRYAKADPISGVTSIYHNGSEQPATIDDLYGLETLAAWGHSHIVERMEAFMAGRTSKFEESLRVWA